MTSDVARATPERTSERGAATRVALLQAAREIFVDKGFAEAGVTDLVGRAQASVGSLYHHFSGKADLYLALWEEFQTRQIQRTKRAVREARGSDPMAVFVAASRAYLDGALEERELAALFLRGDGPPGFELVMREAMSAWTARNAAHFDGGFDGGSDGGFDGDFKDGFKDGFKGGDAAFAVVVTGALARAVSEIVLYGSEAESRRLAEDVLAIIGQIQPVASAGGPSSG